MTVEADCPRCGAPMRVVDGSDWQLRERASVVLRCPRCGHEERVELRAKRK